MRNQYCLLLLLALPPAFANPVKLSIADRYAFAPMHYGAQGAVLADPDRDGRPELVMSGRYWEFVGQTSANGTSLSVIDPATLAIEDVAPFAPEILVSVTAVQPPSGLPQSVITATSSRTIATWSGVPLRRVAQFEIGFGIPLGPLARAGNVDDDAADELIHCGPLTPLSIIDLASHAVAQFEDVTCLDLELVQYDADAAYELAIIPETYTGDPLRIVDGGTGAVLATAPRPTGASMLAANLDDDPHTELVVAAPFGTQKIVVDLVPAWSERRQLDAPGDHFTLADLDLDGRIESLVGTGLAGGHVVVAALATGVRSDATQLFDGRCRGPMLSGDFAPAPGAELACNTNAIVRAGIDPQLRMFSLQQGALATLADETHEAAELDLADMDGDGDDEVLASFQSFVNSGVLVTLDAQTLDETARIVLPPNAPFHTGYGVRAIAVQADDDVAKELVVSGTDAGDKALVALLQPGTATPAWSDRGELRLGPEIARVNADGGADEVALVERDDLRCRVALVDTTSGARRWTSAWFDASAGIDNTAVTAYGTGSDAIVAVACAGRVSAHRATDGAALWRTEFIATDLDVVESGAQAELVATGRELDPATGPRVQHRSLATGELLATYPGTGVDTAGYRPQQRRFTRRGASGADPASRAAGTIAALDARSGGTIATLPVGSSLANSLLSRPSPTVANATDFYVGVPSGIVRVQARELPAVTLNQHGLTGFWYAPKTAGQGFALEFFPDSTSPGNGALFGGWFTFGRLVFDPDMQRWYSLGGAVRATDSAVVLPVFVNDGGAFASPPITQARQVGTASLAVTSCTTALLTYELGLDTGEIELERLTPNVECGTTPTTEDAADFAFSGNWFDPSTSGQGFVIEVNPRQPLVFLSWYTYAASGDGSPRWFSGQAAHVSGARSFTMPLYATTGGRFDQTPSSAQRTDVVGTATLAFTSCAHGTLAYTFTRGENAGRSGTIPLERAGPVPPSCRF